jgi:hypothetical protein
LFNTHTSVKDTLLLGEEGFSVVTFSPLLGPLLGHKVVNALNVLFISVWCIPKHIKVHRAIFDVVSAVVNHSGSMLLRHLQGLLSSKSLEKLAEEARLALFLTLFATISIVHYHQFETVS